MADRDYATEALDALAPIRKAFEDRVARRTSLGIIQPPPVGDTNLASSQQVVTPQGDETDVNLLSATFNQQLKKFLQAAGKRVSVTSQKRDTAKQTKLWNEALAKYGTSDLARKFVAPPGGSYHEKGESGLAADLHFLDDASRQWAHQVADQYGLYFPLDNEPWHVEPVTTRSLRAKKK
jgi:LAS superfamily LD-carboxypeptidase LdcB